MPRGTSGSSANVCSSCSSELEPAVERRRAWRSVGVPISSASARSGAAVRSARDAGPQLAEQAARCCAGTGAGCGNDSDRRRRAPAAPSVIESWMNGRATSSQRGERGVEVARTARPAPRPPARRSRAVSPSSAKKRAQVRVSGSDRFCATGMMSRSSGRSAPIAVLIARAAAGERVAEARRGSSCDRRARRRRRTCSRTRRTRPASGVAAASGIVSPSSKPSSERAARDLDVLEAERRARADDQRRVLRQRLDVACSSLRPSTRDAGAVVAALRR